ncbi:MAG TPA: hypothetical protein VMI12_06060 [Puia sp.]|nr:hypothetical protein [Puia sp.]
MRYLLLLVTLFLFSQAYSQPNCLKNSKLYYFDPTVSAPRNFTERLGNHPQFPFLQEKNGVNTTAAFIASINNPENQQKYNREFLAFDLLLRNSGFTNGYKDLNDDNVENVFVPKGTIGNLGFYDPKKDRISYIYVKLNPAGEPKNGVPAWKLTTAKGCYLYILHTCGNAFYPNDNPKALTSGRGKGVRVGVGAAGGCKIVSVSTQSDPLELKPDSVDRKLHVGIDFYEARLVRSKHSKSGYDTVVSFVKHIDTVNAFKEKEGKDMTINVNAVANNIKVCKDTSFKLFNRFIIDSVGSPAKNKAISLTFSDTAYIKEEKDKNSCKNKIEIDIDGGVSFNSIPRLNSPTQHTQTDGMHIAGEIAIAQIFNPWIQAGISASYITLSYQDDVPYPGSIAPAAYNKVYLGDPIIPVQLFGKFTFGKEVGWQSTLTLAVGYSIPTKGRIVSNGTTLTTSPNLEGAPTAGVRMGINYFFTCKFGLGISTGAQYFSNRGDAMKYSLFALPITGGLRIRF